MPEIQKWIKKIHKKVRQTKIIYKQKVMCAIQIKK